MRTKLPDADLIPRYYSRHGYWSAGSGRILHYFIDADSWDDYFPDRYTENPFPRTLYPEKRPVSLPRAGSWQYVETDWGSLDVSGKDFGGDWLVTDWIGKQLRTLHEKPIFLACGICRPHEPWFVPKQYFDRFPLEERWTTGVEFSRVAGGSNRGMVPTHAHIDESRQPHGSLRALAIHSLYRWFGRALRSWQRS